MPKASAIELCRQYLFEEAEAMNGFPDCDRDLVLRVRDMYMLFLASPQMDDAKFVNEDTKRHKVSRPTAYSDLAVVKTLLPELSKTARDFHRWRYTRMILATFEAALTKGNLVVMEKAASSYAKYMNIDRQDETIDLALIAPQPFIPTMDPRVLGIEPLPDLKERKKKLLERYMKEIPDVQDIEFEDIDVEGIASAPLKIPENGKDLF